MGDEQLIKLIYINVGENEALSQNPHTAATSFELSIGFLILKKKVSVMYNISYLFLFKKNISC